MTMATQRSHPTIEALVFDFGGVLTVDQVTSTVLSLYDRLLGWPSGSLLLRLFSGPVWEAASRGEISRAAYWKQVGQALESRLPPTFARFREGPFVIEPMNPEMVELVIRLGERYRLALCSNALDTLRADLEAQPALLEAFEVVIISAEVGMRKPDPGIFELTAQRLDLPLSACLLIDDKPRNTTAAQAIGMQAITFHSAAQVCRELAARDIRV